ncbi:protein LEG1 homolog [Rattus norvegicus]|uniref:Liver enriched gene 1 n=3 Tax=Rattus norvegicus TaxID=10116 RepID=F1M171_RAT|nr:protein LEG1 homolog [Rattus norvegicus]|eukprot:XP_217725.3 PREDICTED: protein LEG1 homolog [Rattus norvegicus]
MAVLASWVWILTGCFSPAVAEISNVVSLYPPLWEDSPEQISDYRMEDGKYVINPWVLTDRMGMYRILLNETATYFARYGPENEQNLLWGLPLQFGWQYQTGRLADPTGMTDCGKELEESLCVSVNSWWADVNYYLSVLPFLAAVDSGMTGLSPNQIMILPPLKDQMRFCYNVSDCRSALPKTMDKWRDFFQYMQLPSSDFDGLLKKLWDAHTSSLEYPTRAFVDRYDFYSDQEANFGENWAIVVYYLGAARLPTTLNRSHSFQRGLPTRVLDDTDITPFIPDFTPLQNKVLVTLKLFGNTDRLSGSLSLTIWESLMSTKFARGLFLKAFEEFLGTSP